MSNERILIVEDENIVALDIQRTLQQLGYQVPLTVSNSKEALQAVEECRPDLILMDIRIKGDVDGIDTAKIIWERFQIPIIFLTAYADEQTLSRAKMAQPFGYILKPFEDLELRTNIEVTLEKSRSLARKDKKTEIEIKETQKSLQSTRDMLKVIMDAAPVIIFVKDIEGRYLQVNESFLKLVNKERQEILGKTDFDLFSKEMATKYRENDQQVIQRQTAQEVEEVTIQNGKTITYLSIKFPIQDEDGKIYAIGGISNDITERKLIEAQRIHLLNELQQTINLRDEFITLASHELRTPLTSVKLQNQMSLKFISKTDQLSNSHKPKLIDSLEFIEGELNKINRLIEDILDIYRIKNGKIKLEKSRINLGEIVTSCIHRHQKMLQLAGIDVVLKIGPSNEGKWDQDRLEQVMTILLSNAAKYAPNRPLEITIKQNERSVELTMKDRGIGIPKSEQKRIFNCFERAIGTINISGLGLGLFLADHIINMHGGRIDVESEPGQGATFKVVLPNAEVLEAHASMGI